MSKSYALRRSREQWETLVEQWQQSGQSALQFCKEQGVGYASFCQWRKRLESAPVLESATPEASFIDLASLGPSVGEYGWHIVLSLGSGVELTLSQR